MYNLVGLYVCSSATDRFGDQQDPAAVSVSSPVQPTVQREEVQFKGKELKEWFKVFTSV